MRSVLVARAAPLAALAAPQRSASRLHAAPRRGPPPSRRARPPCASGAGPTASGEEPLPDVAKAGISPILEVERQSERVLAYGAIAGGLGVAGALLSLAPATAVQFVWAACPSPLVAGLARISGALLLLAAVCAHCLKEAAEHDRLRSETYQRLNLALMWWGAVCALALWLGPQQPLRLSLGVCTALLGATSAHAALTYQETSDRGLDPIYLARRFLSSLGNLSSYHNTGDTALLPLYGYGLAAKAALASATCIVLEGHLRLVQDGLLLVPLGALGASIGAVNGVGYLLLSVVLFTLKDAACRGRLGASTFRALNVGVAVVALALELFVVSSMQAGLIARNKLAVSQAASLAALLALAVYNYFFAKK